ncbi:hypothetical protein Vadar_010990 [Vaccinium darrowii]|uniref:Uncharacterized protein n=1 Tax=Vaccinium darrowii TaxID=229202 RepID=A0ACB7Y639_9ERIC|nr:hypothetical protein Vadar_010990 [Vaccinium darrowii]
MATLVAVSVNKERTRGEIFGEEKNSVVSQPFIEQYCFRAPYIVLLLREGLHITDDQNQRFAEVWTLGVALLQAGNGFPTKAEVRSCEILQMIGEICSAKRERWIDF